VIDRKQRDIACVPVEPGRSFVYTEGWQSWSSVGTLPATACPDRASAPMSVVTDCQYAAAAPDGVHQGSGLLAIDPGDGEPVSAGTVGGQPCTALDITHPAAAQYLVGALGTMRDCGVGYFTTDCMYAGAAEGRRHEDVTGVVAYRRALQLIRDAIGPQALLVSGGAPVLPSVGLVDAMRVGPYTAAGSEPAGGSPSWPSPWAAARNSMARAWQQGRFWVNDTGCLMAQPGVERRADWAALVEQFGGLRSSGDALRRLDGWGLETTRRLLVPSPTGPVV
jgi:alpha-galactosidase